MLSGFKKVVKNIFIAIIPDFLKYEIIKRNNQDASLSFSQEGEDILLNRIISNIEIKGFFIDIGAHHPKKFSNTYLLYKAGWCGINIDAMPGSMEAFRALRPKDINLEVPLSDKIEQLEYHVFNFPELNTFSKENVEKWEAHDFIHLKKIIKLKTTTINKVLYQYAPNMVHIDLLSIDVEGLDFLILNSLDWELYKFRYIIVEDKAEDIKLVLEGPIYKLLNEKGYRLLSKLYYSCIYEYEN